ncbi:hypothetical protein BDZ94DRAFT_1245986, partial [Collybia nuda]
MTPSPYCLEYFSKNSLFSLYIYYTDRALERRIQFHIREMKSTLHAETTPPDHHKSSVKWGP